MNSTFIMEETKSRADTSSNKKVPTYDVAESDSGVILENVDDLKRQLMSRQMQMKAIGGSIGTALFVSISSVLAHGGPGFTVYCLLHQ